MTNQSRQIIGATTFVALYLLAGCAGFFGGPWGYVQENDVWTFRTNNETYVLSNIDRGSFAAIDQQYAKDKLNVYFRTRILKNADPSSFIRLAKNYSKDNKNVYYEDFRLHDANPQTFVVLDSSWAKDREHVYSFGQIIDGADASTFVVTNNGVASDKSGCFDVRRRIACQSADVLPPKPDRSNR